MGFTAINASVASTAADPHALKQGHSKNDGTTTTIASEYLGRGETKPSAAPVAVTSKKVAAKGKKRAAATKETTKTKRSKSSNVDDGLQITKTPRAKEPKGRAVPSDQPQQEAANRGKPKKKSAVAVSKPKDDLQYISGEHTEAIPSITKPVSVYAQTTSMDALDSTSARTSIASVKANAGQSITVYQDPSSSISLSSKADFSQPWLNDATDVSTQVKKKKTAVATKKLNKAQNVDEDAVDASCTEVRRSTRAKRDVNYAAQNNIIVIDDDDPSDSAVPEPPSIMNRRRTQSSETIGADDGFGDIDDEDILESAMAVDDAIVNRPTTPPPRGRKQNMRDVDEHEDYGGALLTNDDLKLLAQIKTKESKKEPFDKPIVRKPFLPSIQDRSPIFGASNSTLLRTCFRVGEALNTGSQAVRCNKNVIIELYARVTSSWREPPPGRKQHFVFKDLYHDRPPYLEGVYKLWDQTKLWDLDSKPFIKATEKGIMARAIARMKREGQKWRLEVLSVYEASWKDVNHVAGICNGDVQEDEDDE